MKNTKPVSSCSLRKERRIKALKKAGDIITIALGVALGSALWLLSVWIIQVVVTSI